MRIKRIIIALGIMLIAICVVNMNKVNAIDDEIVTFNDANLKSLLISKGYDFNGDGELSKSEMEKMINFPGGYSTFSDLTGLEYAINLETLYLANQNITDISPLSSLTNLGYLNLCNNNITDISPLSSLTNLKRLHLSDNQITDITALSSLTNLAELGINNNSIRDISALSKLTKIQWLDLNNNNISDISAFSNFTFLYRLDLSYNYIEDFTPLSSVSINLLLTEGQRKIYLLGDVTGDGKITMGDYARIKAHLEGINPITDETVLKAADVTGNGEIDYGDLAKVLAYIYGEISSL